MSERTFRAASPARSQPVPSASDAPPVPAIPNNVLQQGRPPIPAKSHRRASSLEQNRVASPPPNQASGRGSSLGPVASNSPRKGGQRMTSLSSVQELTGLERPASRGSVTSINFSYPTSLRPTSPESLVGQRRLTSPSPQRVQRPAPRITSPTNQNLIYDPNTRSFLSIAEIHAIEQRINGVANAPMKKMKRVAPKQAQGTHLVDQTVGGRPRGTAIDAIEAAATQQSASVKHASKPKLAPEPESQIVREPAPVRCLFPSQRLLRQRRRKRRELL